MIQENRLSKWDINLVEIAILNYVYFFSQCTYFFHLFYFERMIISMDTNKIVCNCYSITNGMIKEAVDNGATTLEEVQDATSAGTACGACLDDVQRLVDEFVAEKNY